MRIVVTGCAGFVGSHLTDALLELGHDVVGLDVAAAPVANLERALDSERFSFSRLDLAADDLGGAVDGADVVLHLAGEPGVRSSWGGDFARYARANVLATQRLLEALVRRPGPRLVHASSSSVYGESGAQGTSAEVVPAPRSPYGVTKRAAEQLCDAYAAAHGLRIAQLRLFSVYGPRQRPDMAFARFCAALQTGAAIELHGDGGQTRDFTYVGDVVAAFVAAALTPTATGHTLDIGGGEPARLDEALEGLFAVSGRRVAVHRGPPIRGDLRDTAASMSAAAEVLGYAPVVGLADGLAAQWAWSVDVSPRRLASSHPSSTTATGTVAGSVSK